MGKTVLAREILNYFNYTDGLIIHPDEARKGGYGDLSVALTATLSTLNATIDNKQYIDDFYNERRGRGQVNKQPPSFLVLDNCPGELYNYHLHKQWANLLLIMAQQYPGDVINRPDYLFIYSTSVLKDRKKIYDHYIANPASEATVTFEAFCQLLDACTAKPDDRECLVFEMKTKKMYWYKAAIQPSCPAFLQQSQPQRITLGVIVDEYAKNAEFKKHVDGYFNTSSAT